MKVLHYIAFVMLLFMTAACSALCVHGFVTGNYFVFIFNFITTFLNAQTIGKAFSK